MGSNRTTGRARELEADRGATPSTPEARSPTSLPAHVTKTARGCLHFPLKSMGGVEEISHTKLGRKVGIILKLTPLVSCGVTLKVSSGVSFTRFRINDPQIAKLCARSK